MDVAHRLNGDVMNEYCLLWPVILLAQLATDSLGDIWKIICFGFEKSQRSMTHDSLRYINIFAYLLTYCDVLVKWRKTLLPNRLKFGLNLNVAAPHKYYVGFRYVDPLLEDAVEQMERQVKHCGSCIVIEWSNVRCILCRL